MGLPRCDRTGWISRFKNSPVLLGSWVVVSRVISLLKWVITIVTLLITPLITTHEPPGTRKHGVKTSAVLCCGGKKTG